MEISVFVSVKCSAHCPQPVRRLLNVSYRGLSEPFLPLDLCVHAILFNFMQRVLREIFCILLSNGVCGERESKRILEMTFVYLIVLR